MARINIEDQFWLDICEVAVKIGNQDIAIGMAVRFFRYSQEKHKAGEILSESEFSERFDEALIPTFARRVAGGIQAVGAEKHFDWLNQKIEAGRKGGRSTSDVKLANLKQYRPKRTEAKPSGTEAKGSETEAEPKRPEAEPVNTPFSASEAAFSVVANVEFTPQEQNRPKRKVAKPKPLPLPLSLPLPLPQALPLFSEGEIALLTESPPIKSPALDVQGLIALYCDHWKARYGASPEITGKASGQIKTLAKDLGFQKCSEMIRAYLDMPDSWFVTKGHDIPTMIGNLNLITQFLANGKIITKAQIRELDSGVNAQQTIEALRRGEV